MVNKVFDTDFDKTNVVALWTKKMLEGFSNEQLEELSRNAQLVTGVVSRRLILRINDVKKERKEWAKNQGGKH